MSLRAILGGSRVKKRTKSTAATSRASPASTPSSSTSAPSSAWPATLRRTKSSAATSSTGKPAKRPSAAARSRTADADQDPLDDIGIVHILATDLSLRDVPQALRHVRERMFDSVPPGGGGLGSQRVAEVLNLRRALPPVASASHVATLLARAGPTATEREIAELVRAGTLRRIVVPRRGDIGEVLVETESLESLVRRASGLGEDTKEVFLRLLREEKGALVLRSGQRGLTAEMADQLVRCGFLSANHHAPGRSEGLYARPEDRTTLVSLETVARAASGSFEAVGGAGAVHNAGGSGARGGSNHQLASDLTLAIPGMGSFLKLVTESLAHLSALLERSAHREATESRLRELWDGGGGLEEAQVAATRARGEFSSTMPAKTKKWKEMYGVSFDWVLAEAVGSGRVEVFETGSVGRGVRLVG